GSGGRVGLKGSDGKDIVEKAFAMGAVPEAPSKASKALERLQNLKEKFRLLTYPGPMGEDVARELGYDPVVLGHLDGNRTSAADTERAVKDLWEAGAELLLFAGGDGTARDVYNVIGNSLPVIGIPAGVKIHSAVYADTPAHAGDAAALFLSGSGRIQMREAEVMDIDEDAFRRDRLSAKLYGYMTVPNVRNLMQSAKAGSVSSEGESMMSIASHIVTNMEPGVCYFVGPGTTMRCVMDLLGLKNTLLGVDAVLNKQLVGSDLNEAGLLKLLDEMESRGIPVKVIVTVIGGQGYLFGRGNQQLSHRVLRRVGKENIIVGATESKMIALGGKPLLVDTGDAEVNEMLSGYVKVITSMNRQMVYRVAY
ncbi:MAG TPA: ATP-NAD kinase family protein, partial [Bacillota bacterium]|nr:ATP-NAD kinase family protein [Bacillota bacterium]